MSLFFTAITGHQECDPSSDGQRGHWLIFKTVKEEPWGCTVTWLVWVLLKRQVESCSWGLAAAWWHHLAYVRNMHALSKRAEENCNFLFSIVKMESWLLSEL